MKEKTSIAFASTDYVNLQQKYILKKCREAQTEQKAKVGIVTCNLHNSYYTKQLKLFALNGPEVEYSDDVRLFDWNFFLEEMDSEKLMQRLEEYDYVFWDLPELEILWKREKHFLKYFKYIQKVNILSANPQNLPKDKFEREVRSYFESHNLPLGLPESRPGYWSRIRQLFQSQKW